MLNLRFGSPGPFWFEDLAFFVVDEARRLPKRATNAAATIARLARAARASTIAAALANPKRALLGAKAPVAAPLSKIRIHEADLLDEPLAWKLATEPLVATGTGANAAIALHNAAAEQLDALTYVLDQLHHELRPLMTYAELERDGARKLDILASLDAPISALREVSRKAKSPRRKRKAQSAA